MPDPTDVAVALEHAGLYDPTAPDAAAMLELLRAVLAGGYTVEQLVEARDKVGLPRAMSDLVLWGTPERITLAEVAARSGLPEETVRYARRLLGFADPGEEARCRPREVDAFAAVAAGIALFGEERTLQFTRVLGMTGAAGAEAAITLFAGTVRSSMDAAGASDAEYVATARTATEAFLMVCRAVDVILRLHFEAAGGRFQGAVVHETPFAIAFVDLVESTALSRERMPDELAGALRDFDRHAAEAAGGHGVRLVKLVGDSAMLAGRETSSVADAAHTLLTAVGRDARLRGARGGLAFGAVSARDGDYFGTVVNLAARAATAAAVGELLADAGAAEVLGDRTEPAGTYSLKGFDDPQVLARVRN